MAVTVCLDLADLVKIAGATKTTEHNRPDLVVVQGTEVMVFKTSQCLRLSPVGRQLFWVHWVAYRLVYWWIGRVGSGH